MARLMALLTTAALLVGAAPTARAKCARVMLVPQVLTHPADQIPAGGGILVGYADSTDDDAERFGTDDPAAHADWSMQVGKRRVRPRLDVLAPGLAVYRPTATRTARPVTVRLQEADGKLVGTFTSGRGTRAWAPGQPQVQGITSVTSQAGKGYRDRATTTVTATVAAVPTGAVAVIAYRTASGQRVPIGWSRVAPGVPTLRLYASPSRCSSDPPGREAPAAGEKIRLAWVDAFGRISTMSAPVAVR